MNLIDFYSRIQRPLILDGAVGSELELKGFANTDRLWSSTANLFYPEQVKSIHESYINAGADIITTNTFRTNPAALINTDIKCNEIVSRAVRLAKAAIGEKEILLAGSNPPAEDCYQLDRTISSDKLEENHKTHIDNLVDSGVDIIWNETFSHLDELKIVCSYCDSLKIDYSINLFFNEDLELLSGQSFSEVINILNDFNPLVIGFNCMSLKIFKSLINQNSLPKRFGFYLNCGLNSVNNKQFKEFISPLEYAKNVSEYLDMKPLFAGSCCGSNPAHTKILKEIVIEQNTY
jgi:methionine synthase I (cobalamin-dependent)